MSPRSNTLTQRGSAPAEFVLVSVLLVALALAIIHVSLVAHTRAILQASAWEGARYASYFATADSEGVALTDSLIRQALGDNSAHSISVNHTEVGGQPGLTITVESGIPHTGLWSFGAAIDVSASVAYEQPR